MIGKVINGKSFGGCLRYLMNRPEATVLGAEGVRMDSARAAAIDFNLQRKMNPGLGKAVGHLILSWSNEDRPKLSPAIMTERAREYMEKMRIRNTQYLVVQHTDREHPHIHIVYNRVNNEGKTLSDRFQRQLNVRVCRAMTQKYGYHLAEGKQQVNRQRLKGADKIRYEVYDVIRGAARTAINWKELEKTLRQEGIGIQYKYRSGTSEVQGISFSKDGMTFKGSAVDRAFSYGKLSEFLKSNLLRAAVERSQHPYLAPALKPERIQKTAKPTFTLPGSRRTESLLGILLKPEPVGTEPDPAEIERKRKKKRKNQHRGIHL